MFGEEPHPLVLELTSLRQTAARFQHEAHAAATKLQRHILETSRAQWNAVALEQENARLKEELECIRANPDAAPHPAAAQVQELTLALRRVSEKIELTENTLLERTTELAHARSEFVKARYDADGAYEFATQVRSREEESRARERGLEVKARASEEERKMVDLVVREYADLVRSLEGRRSLNPLSPISDASASTITLVDSLHEGKSGLHKLFAEFSAETANLHATISELRGQISSLQTTIAAQRKTALHDRTLLSQANTELDKLKLEDQTAAKMVSRYMKFSQASTNALQQQIMTLKTRHASTISTLQLQLSIAESHFASERSRVSRLQDALDELCEDVVRETYGRRREVALRLALLAREEGVAESMRRWARRAKELYDRCNPPSNENTLDSAQLPTPKLSPEHGVREAFHRVVSDADSLLRALDGDLEFSDGTRTSGSLARIAVSREAVETLRGELQDEVKKRVEAVRRTALLSGLNESPNTHVPQSEELTERRTRQSQDVEGGHEHLLFTPSNGDATRQHDLARDGPPSRDAGSPMSPIGAPQEIIDDPFAPVRLITDTKTLHSNETPRHSVVHTQSHSPISQAGFPVSPALLVADEELRPVQGLSPAVSVLELQQVHQSAPAEEPRIVDAAPSRGLENHSTDTPELHPVAACEPPIRHDTEGGIGDDVLIPSEPPLIPGDASQSPHSQSNSPPPWLSSLNATKNRYDSLQRAFRDCSLALRELKRTVIAPSPSPAQVNGQMLQHLQTALSRIDDYAEDARVELEIRAADEELTVRGFETLLSIPGAFSDPTERVGVEESARRFADGTDDGISKALECFGKKLEDVQHDIAVIKRAIHELPQEREDNSSEDANGASWSAWTAGLLGTSPSPARSPTPGATFGSVMTSPRLRHSPSLRQLHSPDAHGSHERGGPLAGLNLRIPLPPPPTSSYSNLGLGRAPETRPRTISTMYSIGLGGRTSSLALGVGLSGSSSSPSRSKTTRPAISRLISAPLVPRGEATNEKNTNIYDFDDHGDVE
ncbi:hypothetical protein PAXRUDRAFT_155583 [Paxillus rubicundulus Ve08.2h10]|uniref:Uncharacterized protein n=1 Tax=Paxillus rubicundulus Ve08.2h10 TaxID=930991 RepID=A0A0D0DJ57_9AGAM|nr:hypothetical protein PAXRUDRAFT_155583 [Paxillus rubicundulus Ve08.2h10]